MFDDNTSTMENTFTSTKILLSLLDIKYTTKYLKDSILSHPEHNSLLSISDTLEKYKIETLTVKIDFEKLKEMPLPSVVQIEVDKQYLFFVLKDVFDNKVSYYDYKKKLIEVSKKEFINQWTGICLLAETSEVSQEPQIEKKLLAKRIQNILQGSTVTLLLSWIAIHFLNPEAVVDITSTLYSIGYILLKGIGLTVGMFLLWFEVDQYNPTLQSFCSGGNKKINCNAVLGSKHAELFNGTISLSLLAFSYFFGTLLFLTISSFSPSALSAVGILSFISLPMVLISIFYQAFIIKQWCRFCIIIQGALIAEISITFFSGFYNTPIIYELLPLLLALLLIPILGWKLLKPLLEQEKETNLHKRALKKIKNNPNVLEGLLVKSRKIETKPEGLGISINNTTAKYHVIKVCNPYCGPCAKAHPVLEYLVNTGKIDLQMLFTANADGKDIKAKPVSHFLAIDEMGNKNKIQQALDDWYMTDQKDYDVFADKYPMNGELEQQNNKIEAMRKWCVAEKITHTPTIFINGYELPKEYSIDDLREVLQ